MPLPSIARSFNLKANADGSKLAPFLPLCQLLAQTEEGPPSHEPNRLSRTSKHRNMENITQACCRSCPSMSCPRAIMRRVFFRKGGRRGQNSSFKWPPHSRVARFQQTRPQMSTTPYMLIIRPIRRIRKPDLGKLNHSPEVTQLESKGWRDTTVLQ